MSKKTKSKSVDKNESSKTKVSKSTSGSGILTKLFSFLILAKVIFSLYLLYSAYVSLTRVPSLPKVDLNIRWGADNATEDSRIRPYKVIFTDGMEAEIRALFEAYRSMDRKIKSLKDTAWTYGVHSDAFAQFFSYWIFKYKFLERPRFLNKYDHFLTNIQGLDIHFVRVKPDAPKNVKVVPLLLLHGWPGSFREFYEAIPLLTTPRAGYDFVFEVIIPSLPGFIFSEAPTRPGLDTYQMSIIIRNLMQRLGFSQYYIQGGDFGHVIGSNIATLFPKEVLGFHTNFPVNSSKLSLLTWLFGGLLPSYFGNGIVERMYPLSEKWAFYLEETGYSHLQATKPDTIGVVLNDSPVALASYILDKVMIYTNHSNKFEEDGGLEKYYNFDKLLDNIMLYWISGSITTSMRLYKESFGENKSKIDLSQIPTNVPTWALRFKYELFQQPDYILQWKYTNLIGSTTVDYGGHFAAFERPEDFTNDVLKAVKAFRSFK